MCLFASKFKRTRQQRVTPHCVLTYCCSV